jgi:hypothetical protein
MALSFIGHNRTRITSLNDSNEEARRFNELFHPARRSILRDYEWNFATAIDSLALSANDNIKGWEYAYIYPSECLKPRRIFNDGTPENGTEEYRQLYSSTNKFQIIACNISPACMEYTADITNAAQFDASFVEALAFYLAWQVAPSITGNAKLTEQMLNLSGIAMVKARKADAEVGYQNYAAKENNKYVNARG